MATEIPKEELVAQLSQLPPREMLEALEALAEHRGSNKLEFYTPYPKQREFFAASATAAEILFKAGNQVGKSDAGAYAMACHLTGLYPDWWEGRRFDHPIRAWACGEAAADVRDVQQDKLFGAPGVDGSLGTGFVPADCIVDKSLARGIPDAFDSVQVKHYTNGVYDGISQLWFKSYEQGRKKFQGRPLHVIWDDEEPPMEIYTEQCARLTATRGFIYTTYTPFQGMTEVTCRFLDEPTPDRVTITMAVTDAAHMDEAAIAAAKAKYPRHEWAARLDGIPKLGSGAIFTFPEDDIRINLPLNLIPIGWSKLWGIDFGIDHPFAAVLLAWDKDETPVMAGGKLPVERHLTIEEQVEWATRASNMPFSAAAYTGTLYVLAEVRMSNALPREHSDAIKRIASNVPVAWPHDGNVRDKGSGQALSQIYKAEGLNMLASHAAFADGSISTEAGIREIETFMLTRRFLVNLSCPKWFEEYGRYHRKDGMIVKVGDDLMSATRQAVVYRRMAKAVPLGQHKPQRPRPQLAIGADPNPWGF